MRLFSVFPAALLLAPFTAFACVIHACVKNAGTIKIVADPVDCGQGDTPLSWNVQGPQADPGPQGPPSPSPRVFDALGTEVGLLAQWHNPNDEFRTYPVSLESVRATILLDVGGKLVIESPGGQVFLAEPDCTGQAYDDRRYVATVTGEGGRLFIGREVPSSNPDSESRLPGPTCANDQLSSPLMNSVPADEITLDDLGLSFPRPTGATAGRRRPTRSVMREHCGRFGDGAPSPQRATGVRTPPPRRPETATAPAARAP